MVKTMMTPSVPMGLQDAEEEFGGGLELAAAGIDEANGLGLLGGKLLEQRGGRRRRWSGEGGGGEVLADAFDGGEGGFERLLGGRVDGGGAFLDTEAVGGKVAGDAQKLMGDDVADAEDGGEGEDAGEGDGDDAGSAQSFEAGDGGGEQEGEGESEGEGDEKLAGEVEEEDQDGEHDDGLEPGKVGGARW